MSSFILSCNYICGYTKILNEITCSANNVFALLLSIISH